MKVTVKGWLHWQKSAYEEKPYYTVWQHDMSNCGPEYVPIMQVETTYEIPDSFNPIPLQVAALRQKKREVMAESEQKLNDLEGQIQNLLCLELKPEGK